MKGLGRVGVWIVILLFQGWSAQGKQWTIIVAGVATGTEAAQMERKISGEIGTLLPKEGKEIGIRTDEAGGVRLVKVLASLDDRDVKRLLPLLKERFSGMVILSPLSEARPNGALSGREEAGIAPLLDLLGIRLRWEWGALGILALIGTLWLFLRHRRLGKLDSEQRRLYYRQSSIWARLRKESDGE